MSSTVRAWLVPLLTAGAVLAVIAGAVWMQGPGGSGGEVDTAAGGGAGGRQGYDSSPYGGGQGDGRQGDQDTVGAGPDAIGVDSYYAYDAQHLALNFSNGVPECYGRAGGPRVEETADAVVVTIPRIAPSPSDDDVVCIDIALMLSVDVYLDEPLGDRPVLDASRGRATVPEADAVYGEGPTY